MRLSKPQIDLLRQAIETGSVRAVDSYPPVKKLQEIGFLTRHVRWDAYEPSAAGREWWRQNGAPQ